MQHTEPNEVWYKQFWPWFLIALPASVVVAGIITVVIAIRNADSLVTENYYKDGLAINRELQLEKNAQQLKLAVSLYIDQLTGEVRVAVKSEKGLQLTSLLLFLRHPTDKQQDLSLVLGRTPRGDYLAQLDEPIKGRWYIQLSDQEHKMWRLNSDINLQTQSQVEMGTREES
jgi:uncharacterized protein